VSALSWTEPPTIEGYRSIKPLGGGGFADVYLYERNDTGASHAVKVLRADGEDQQSTLDQLRAEARTMGMLTRSGQHRHIVAIYSTGVVSGRPYLAMEYCPQGSLARRLEVDGPFSVLEVLRIGVQIAGALATVHAAGVNHLDLKPANILVGANGDPKLSDFGIATSTATGARVLAGYSPLYSPPEIITRTAADHRSDLYSLAATLYALLAGRAPYVVVAGDNTDAAIRHRILHEPVPPIGRPAVPDDLSRLLESALLQDPVERGKRVASAVAFANQLRSIQQGLGYPVTPLEAEPVPAPRSTLEVEPVPDARSASGTTAPVDPARRVWAPPPEPLANVPAGLPGRPVDHDRPGSQTSHRGSVHSGQSGSDASDSGRGAGRRVGVVAAVVVLLAAGAAVAWLGSRGGTRPSAPKITQASTDQPDAVPDAGQPVPIPVVKAAWTAPTVVTFSWTYDGPAAGDYFRVRLITDGRNQTETVLAPQWKVTAQPGTHPCAEVTVNRENGRSSPEPGRACAP
jgi:serine/threonine protein kinase